MFNDYDKTQTTFYQKAIKKDARLSVDYWHKKNVSTSELQKVHRSLAKRSNQRLVRLENAVSKVTGETYDSFGAGDIAKEYLKAKGTKGKLRFSESLGNKKTDINRVELLKDISAMQKFLTSKSSTVQGQKDIEKKRLKTFSAPVYDVEGELVRNPIQSATNKEFYDFLTSETYKEATKNFNSETIVEAYDLARTLGKTHNEIIDAFVEYSKTQNQTVKGLRQTLGLKELI